MKSLMLAAAMLLMGTACFAQTRNLPKPNMKRQTLSVMGSFKQRKSVRAYSAKQLSEQDLSDLLWAAQGKNREDGHLTSPTAMNRQEIHFAKAAPVSLVMVADMDKFGSNNQHAQWMVGADVGIVSQNINLFCAAAGLCTVPRGTMNQKAIQQLLKLGENQIPVLNNPVGYPAK